jgi:hypothetical protein
VQREVQSKEESCPERNPCIERSPVHREVQSREESSKERSPVKRGVQFTESSPVHREVQSERSFYKRSPMQR